MELGTESFIVQHSGCLWVMVWPWFPDLGCRWWLCLIQSLGALKWRLPIASLSPKFTWSFCKMEYDEIPLSRGSLCWSHYQLFVAHSIHCTIPLVYFHVEASGISSSHCISRVFHFPVVLQLSLRCFLGTRNLRSSSFFPSFCVWIPNLGEADLVLCDSFLP